MALDGKYWFVVAGKGARCMRSVSAAYISFGPKIKRRLVGRLSYFCSWIALVQQLRTFCVAERVVHVEPLSHRFLPPVFEAAYEGSDPPVDRAPCDLEGATNRFHLLERIEAFPEIVVRPFELAS